MKIKWDCFFFLWLYFEWNARRGATIAPQSLWVCSPATVRPPHWELTRPPSTQGPAAERAAAPGLGSNVTVLERGLPPDRTRFPQASVTSSRWPLQLPKFVHGGDSARKFRGRVKGVWCPRTTASRKRWPRGRQETGLVPLLLVPCLFTYDMRWLDLIPTILSLPKIMFWGANNE